VLFFTTAINQNKLRVSKQTIPVAAPTLTTFHPPYLLRGLNSEEGAKGRVKKKNPPPLKTRLEHSPSLRCLIQSPNAFISAEGGLAPRGGSKIGKRPIGGVGRVRDGGGPAGGAGTVVAKLILKFGMVLSWGIDVLGWGSRSVAAIVLAKPRWIPTRRIKYRGVFVEFLLCCHHQRSYISEATILWECSWANPGIRVRVG